MMLPVLTRADYKCVIRGQIGQIFTPQKNSGLIEKKKLWSNPKKTQGRAKKNSGLWEENSGFWHNSRAVVSVKVHKKKLVISLH